MHPAALIGRMPPDRRACIRVVPEANLSRGTFRPVVESDRRLSNAIKAPRAACAGIGAEI